MSSITLKEIKQWVNQLPDDFMDYSCVTATRGSILGTDFSFRVDKPIVTLAIDQDTEEVLFLSADTNLPEPEPGTEDGNEPEPEVTEQKQKKCNDGAGCDNCQCGG